MTPERTAEVRVLVLHGDPADLAVLASVIAAHGFELRVIESESELLPEARRYEPDAIVIDVAARGRDGHALCRALKRDAETAGVPVILTSSLDGADARRSAFAAGCDEFLEKPFDRHALTHRLRSFARLRRVWAARSSDHALATLHRLARARDQAAGRDTDALLALTRGFGRHLALDDDEQAALEHAAVLRELGAALLEPLPGAARLADIVRHHHERCDGRGYPDGLLADETPRLARVFRILALYDAFVQGRPPAPPLESTAALAALHHDSAGGGSDPELLALFEQWLVRRCR